MTEQEIKEIQAEIRETQAKLTALQTVANNLTPTEPAASGRLCLLISVEGTQLDRPSADTMIGKTFREVLP